MHPIDCDHLIPHPHQPPGSFSLLALGDRRDPEGPVIIDHQPCPDHHPFPPVRSSLRLGAPKP
eukprot:2241613-Rhodomonas_salina.1